MNSTPTPIIIGLLFKATPNWRSLLANISKIADQELGIFLQDISLEERKEIYRTFEASTVKKIPYVQLAVDTQDWEIKFFIEKFSTRIFSLPAVASSYQVIDRWPISEAGCLIENPSVEIKDPVFAHDVFSRPGIKGICLDTAALETKRLHQPKLYEADINILDHQVVNCVLISPVANTWYGRLLAKPFHLSSLSDLRYLKHFPQKYFSSPLILKLSNSFEEQLEVKKYLSTMFGDNV